MFACAHCGRPVEIQGDDLEQFETIEDAEAAGALVHPECALAYALRDRPPSGRVLMYEGPEIGPLTPDPPS